MGRYNEILDRYNGLNNKSTSVDNLVLADIDFFLFELSMSFLLSGRMLLSLRIYNGLLFRYNGLLISYNRYNKILDRYNELVDCYNG